MPDTDTIVIPQELPYPTKNQNAVPVQPRIAGMSEIVEQSGFLLALRQRFYLPFDALSYVKTSMDEVCERRVNDLQVCDK